MKLFAVRQCQGFSLPEIMAGVFVISLVFLLSVKSFRGIATGFQATTDMTRASNQAQAQLSFMKARGYSALRTTNDSAPIPGLSPTRFYDTVNFPPETITIGGQSCIRYSFVENVERVEGTESVTALPPGSPETGLKRVTVVVTWTERGTLQNVVASNVIGTSRQDIFLLVIKGTVTTPSGVPIPGATVMAPVADERAWGVTGDTGTYRLTAAPGNYTLQAFAPGYETLVATCSLTRVNAPLTMNFALSPRLRVPLEAVMWYNDHPVISRVVPEVDDAGFKKEYVEIFNPTTWTWTVSGQLGLKFQRTPAQDPAALPIAINYVTASVGPGKFFLFANANSVTVNGVTRNADATWAAAGNDAFPYIEDSNIIPINTDDPGEGAGGLELYWISNGATVDRFGWVGGGGQNPGFYETNPLPDPLGTGAEVNEAFCRFSSTSGVSQANGPAYDSGDNSVDWVSSPANALSPRSTADGTLPVVAGVPAVGGWFGTNNPYGMATQAMSTGSPPYASALLSVTTVPFTYDAFYNGFSGRDMLATKPWITPPNQGLVLTLPLKYDSGYYSSNYTVLKGRIIDTLGAPLPNIPVGNNTTFLTKADGSFVLLEMINVGPSPTVGVPWVNKYGNINRRYETPQYGGGATLPAVVTGTTIAGDIVLKGLATLTGIILNEDGTPVTTSRVYLSGAATVGNNYGYTDANGVFRIPVREGTGSLSTDSNSRILPATFPFVINVADIGFDVFTTTFVSKNRLGYLSGRVLENGAPLRTGATIVAVNASYGVLASTAPAPVPSTFMFAPKFRMAQSLPDGTYRIGFDPSVTGYTCNVYAYRTKLEDGVLVTRRADLLNVVTSPDSQTVRDIQW